jgi:transcriptional activator HAC1
MDVLDFAYPHLDPNALHDYYFHAPQPSESDNHFLENEILPIADQFNLDYDSLALNDNSFTEQFNIDEFLHHDEHNTAPEVQSSDSLVESTLGQQPPIGASTQGCDFGGNAVISV